MLWLGVGWRHERWGGGVGDVLAMLLPYRPFPFGLLCRRLAWGRCVVAVFVCRMVCGRMDAL